MVDGFIVYNTATSGTVNVGTTNNVPLSRGFWYYNNSAAGVGTGNKNGGTWTPLVDGATAVKNVTSTEVALSTKIDGKQLYAIKGTFTASGSSTKVSVTVPSGMTGYYTLVTYDGVKTFRREIYSFDITTSIDNVVCGTGAFSEVLPAGNYNYILEYFK